MSKALSSICGGSCSSGDSGVGKSAVKRRVGWLPERVRIRLISGRGGPSNMRICVRKVEVGSNLRNAMNEDVVSACRLDRYGGRYLMGS